MRRVPPLLLGVLWTAAAVGASPPEELLRPAQPVELRLAPGESHVYRADLGPGAWLIAAQQQGLDVEIRARGPGGEDLGTVDSPLDRNGLETLLIEVDAAASYRFEVLAREPGGLPGSCRIQLSTLPRESPRDVARLRAERAATAAGNLYRGGGPERYLEAIDQYREAARHWSDVGDTGRRARALYCTAVLLRLVQDNAAAAAVGREVLSLWREVGDPFFEAATLNELGLNLWHQGETAAARRELELALALHAELGEPFGEGVALSNLCLMDLTQGRLEAGRDCYLRALPLLRAAGAASLEATARSNVGRVYNLLGEPEAALAQYTEALSLLSMTGDRRATARTLNNLAVLHRGLGESHQALVYYSEALEVFRELQDLRWQARVLDNIGLAYYGLGEVERAVGYLEQALALRLELGDPKGEAGTLANLGLVQGWRGDLGPARESLERALHLRDAAGDRRGAAIVRVRLAGVLSRLGESAQALAAIDRALAALRSAGDLANEAGALNRKGEIQLSRDETEAAIASLEQALAAARRVRYPTYQAQADFALARAERRRGRFAAASDHYDAGFDAVESLRARIRSPELRASFGSMKHEAYEGYVDLLMEWHRAEPAAGHAVAALEVAEGARAQSLLDLLHEARADIRSGVDRELLARQVSLERRLSAWALAEADPAGPGETDPAARDEQQAILRELDTVDAEVRRQSPAYAALTRSRPLSGAEVRDLLDPGTILLIYSLGNQRSFLWAVTPTEVAAFELPAKEVIESEVREVHRMVGHAGAAERRRQWLAASELSQLLLGPVAERLADQRLAIVADGALHYLPFAALPSPEGSGGPDSAGRAPRVVDRHEVVYLPSAAALATQRQTAAGRSPAPRWLAVLADPVFSGDDPRVAGAAPEPLQPASTRGGASDGDARFERLPATRREAEALARLAPDGEALQAVDFAARRQWVLDPALGDYRVVHFATHGVIDTQSPTLSGLALSAVDAAGRPVEGFLHLRDIYRLRWSADLVVLSGCRTALGRELRGEGLIGLTRGFMHAGAERVIASLWPVEDQATSALMTELYRAIFDAGQRPAEALRTAQLALRRERRWRDPYYWAGFVLQGDWR